MLRGNNNEEEHIKALTSKINAVLGKVWGEWKKTLKDLIIQGKYIKWIIRLKVTVWEHIVTSWLVVSYFLI